MRTIPDNVFDGLRKICKRNQTRNTTSQETDKNQTPKHTRSWQIQSEARCFKLKDLKTEP